MDIISRYIRVRTLIIRNLRSRIVRIQYYGTEVDLCGNERISESIFEKAGNALKQHFIG